MAIRIPHTVRGNPEESIGISHHIQKNDQGKTTEFISEWFRGWYKHNNTAYWKALRLSWRGK